MTDQLTAYEMWRLLGHDDRIVKPCYGHVILTEDAIWHCSEITGVRTESLGRPQRLRGACRACGAPDDGASACSYCTTERTP